jgi:hypothetical protein
MIVVALIAAAFFLAYSGFRKVSRADLSENSLELAAILRRTSQLAVETGALHRVVIDIDQHAYWAEVCEGARSLRRSSKELAEDQAETADLLQRAQQRMGTNTGPQVEFQDAEQATRLAAALAGHHVGDKKCEPIIDDVIDPSRLASRAEEEDDKKKRGQLGSELFKGIRFREVWVQHLDAAVTSGLVTLQFFPDGAGEKAVIALTDSGDDDSFLERSEFTVLVHGLTGQVTIIDEPVISPEDHLLRNPLGKKEEAR